MVISMVDTTTKVAELTTRNTNPKPTKRRTWERSPVARASSCPVCQRSWKATGSRCRCRYSTLRTSVSSPSAEDDIVHRRRNTSAASASPNSSASPPSGQIAARSPCRIGPSMICRVTSGTTIPASVASSAATVISAR
jgi:hypothetical protein